ncbi:MAG TPA: methyltransferase domain-containing protein [Candidatus Limnocylindria bacterium]|nr:methyltransferase domain-containing protein [Candidatus Limnocylindria bacterium]
MADLPVDLAEEVTARLLRSFDLEGKIHRALEALGPLGGRDVVLVDGAQGVRARQLAALGARLTVLERPGRLARLKAALAGTAGVQVSAGRPAALGLPDSSADAIVAYWTAFRAPSPAEVAEADRVLRPGGRLLVVHDYGRDDVSRIRGDLPEYSTWGRRDGWYLQNGFRMRVIHAFWTFASLAEARSLLTDAFGEAGSRVADTLKRPRLSYNVAIYHRSRPDRADDRAGGTGPVAIDSIQIDGLAAAPAAADSVRPGSVDAIAGLSS